jgi:hypothetical protein
MFSRSQEISLLSNFKLLGVHRFYKHFVPLGLKKNMSTLQGHPH